MSASGRILIVRNVNGRAAFRQYKRLVFSYMSHNIRRSEEPRSSRFLTIGLFGMTNLESALPLLGFGEEFVLVDDGGDC